ncbi:CD44 antigen isoform X5 [Meriones unguiculatus]|uniref:CD44 antigen isoform X5 n=1 Tax=Meriones unguiculatus TaxID=10047 RepID=UPI00293F4C8C|nr:CD44 antigen isoform X5 [Meriones unguiculatus]
MDNFWWHAAWGLCLLQLSLAQPQIDLNITCRYAGVYHVEKNGRYSISRTEAADLCLAFNSTLPTMTQMEKALSMGFETCRYGFIDESVVIPRINPNAICAANHTGVYVLTSSNTSRYDTYCFNASAPLEEDCTSVTDLPNSFEGQVTITIVNRDGTRYSKKGEYRTHQEDIDASNTMDEDVSSGSSSERSTSEGYIFHTNLPTEHPTGDQEDDFFTMTIQTTSTESNTSPASWEPNEENEDETDKSPSFSGSGIDDDEDFISSTIASTPRVSDHTKQNQDKTQWEPIQSNPEVVLQTTTKMTDRDRNSTVAHGENWTQEPQPPFNHHEYQDEEETPHATSTTWAATNSTTEEAATQQKWFENGWQGKYPPTASEDSHVKEGTTVTTASAHNNHPSHRMTTQSQDDVSWTDFFDPISHPMGQGHQTERKDMDSSHSTTLQATEAPSTHLVEDLNRTGPLSVTTSQSHSQNFSTSHGELEEDKDHTTTPIPPTSTRSGKDGRRGASLPKEATTSLEGYTHHYPDTVENGTLIPVTPANTGVFGEMTEMTVAADSDFNVDGSRPGDGDSFIDTSGGSRTVTHGSEVAGHSSGNQDGGVNTTSGPVRKPQIPEWLIILASLLALALILAVCIAVNSRRRCGQKKKLVINSGNGTMEDRKPSELNGEASKSQEMVHLVNKEPSETPDHYMTADETRNLQNVDMKIGV